MSFKIIQSREMDSLKESGQMLVYQLINPLIQLLIKMRVTPNMVTAFGLGINLFATVIFIYGAEYGSRSDHTYVGWAGATILIAGLFDMIDGRLARMSNQANPYGALFDSVIDRYSEMIMFFGICYYFVSQDYFLSSIFAFIAMIGSLMVSYTRARAEGLGVECSVGLMQRPERILIIGVSAMMCGIFSSWTGGNFEVNVSWLPVPIFETIFIFSFPITLLAIFANVTAIRRLLYSKKELASRSL
jgi:Phosphatidylglycerophosphate synthase